jgi:hypothetical protein
MGGACSTHGGMTDVHKISLENDLSEDNIKRSVKEVEHEVRWIRMAYYNYCWVRFC